MDVLTLRYLKERYNYVGVTGTLEDIASNFDYAEGTLTVDTVEPLTFTSSSVTLSSLNSIVKFNFPESFSRLSVSGGLITAGFPKPGVETIYGSIGYNFPQAMSEVYVPIRSTLSRIVVYVLRLGKGSQPNKYCVRKADIAPGKFYTVNITGYNQEFRTSSDVTFPQALSGFNSSTETMPILNMGYLFYTESPSSMTITRGESGVVLLKQVNGNVYLKNDDLNGCIILQGGIIEGNIEGRDGFTGEYDGAVELSDVIVKGTIFNDGHPITIFSGKYNDIENTKNQSSFFGGQEITIYGGSFNNIYVNRLATYGLELGSFRLFGGKYKVRPRDSDCAPGYSVKANPITWEEWPWIVSAD